MDTESLAAAGTKSLDELVREHIDRVLAENKGNISAAARALGLPRRTLQRKLRRYRGGIDTRGTSAL